MVCHGPPVLGCPLYHRQWFLSVLLSRVSSKLATPFMLTTERNYDDVIGAGNVAHVHSSAGSHVGLSGSLSGVLLSQVTPQ